LIIDLLGTPSQEEIEKIPKEKIKKIIKNLPKKDPKNLEDLFPGANPLAIDLMKKMLVFEADKRITVFEALEHEYLKQLHDPTDEPEGKPVDKREFEFENYSLNREQLKGESSEYFLLMME
jgi:serine/threonine protein kinase